MSSTLPQPSRMTPQEYLQWEREQVERHEFYDGEVFSQAGGTRNHSLIGMNMAREVGNLLKGNPCEAHGSDMRILIEATGYHAYPDVSVVCPPVEGPADDLITNPILLVEVLSPSTADFDRGGKFDHYRQIPSLQEYIVIWQDQARLEQRIKNDTGWQLRDIVDLDNRLELESIAGSVALADIYDKVAFSKGA